MCKQYMLGDWYCLHQAMTTTLIQLFCACELLLINYRDYGIYEFFEIIYVQTTSCWTYIQECYTT